MSDALLETIRQYSKSAQQVVDAGYGSPIGKSKLRLHHATYYAVREKIPRLPAQLVVSSRDKAYEMLKSVQMRKRQGRKASKPQTSNLSVRYDARSFSLRDGVVSLTSVEGRIRFPIQVPEYFHKYADWTVRTADLIHRRGKLFLNVVVSRDVEPAAYSTGKVVGVDVGINNLAVTSDGRFYRGVKGKLARFQRLKSRLQAKGTPSAKRHLKRLSGRRSRFMAGLNHRISKQIAKPLTGGDCVVMEDLSGIRDRVTVKDKRKGKALNRQTNGWAFRQLQNYIDYKASAKGVFVVYVDPHYTSKTCSSCGERYSIRPRNRGYFKCLHCGFSLNSDLNASRNLRERLKPLANSRGLHVNQPNVADHEGETPPSGLSPSPATSHLTR